MLIHELLDTTELATMIAAGYVRGATSGDLVLLNYTHRAQFDGVWNPTTRMCRGLIYDRVTQQIVARPFPKFFNHGEHSGGFPSGPIRVTDKIDGSLGIVFINPATGRWQVATRGSFDSPQAQWATAWIRERMLWCAPLWFAPPFRITILTEIIYPQNRIVVDYGDLSELVLLDAIDNATGLPVWALCDQWPGPKAKTYEFSSMSELLAAPARPNAEGFVVYFEETGLRLKVKYDEYVRLHKLITGLSTRSIWEHLSAGKTVDSLVAEIPDEMHDWVRQQVASLARVHDETCRAAEDAFAEAIRQSGRDDRKAFAAIASRHPLRSLLFLLYDGRPIDQVVWRDIKPAGRETFKVDADA